MEDLASTKERIEQLRVEINHHNYRYYVMDSPECALYLFDTHGYRSDDRGRVHKHYQRRTERVSYEEKAVYSSLCCPNLHWY